MVEIPVALSSNDISMRAEADSASDNTSKKTLAVDEGDGKGRPGEEADGLEREGCGEGSADARRDFPSGDYGS